MSKLTKSQKEFFNTFTKTALQNILLSQVKPEFADQVAEASEAVLDDADLTVLRDAIAKEFLERVEFKTIAKVDKFLRSDEYVQVNAAAGEVLKAVEGELGELLQAVAEAIGEVATDEAVAEVVAE